MVALSTLGNPRQGHTVIRVPTVFSTKDSDVVVWSRRCMIYNGGALIREVRDSTFVIKAGRFLEVTIDPLSETRILRGARDSKGSKYIRYFLEGVDGREVKHVELQNLSLNPGTDALNQVPAEFIRMAKIQIDRALSPLRTFPDDFTLARVAAAAPAVALAGAYAAFTDYFLQINVLFQEVLPTDFCERFKIQGLSGVNVMFDARFSIPVPVVPLSFSYQSSVTLGMEMLGGLTAIQVCSERVEIRPAMCVQVYPFRMDQLISDSEEQPRPGIKSVDIFQTKEVIKPAMGRGDDRKAGPYGVARDSSYEVR